MYIKKHTTKAVCSKCGRTVLFVDRELCHKAYDDRRCWGKGYCDGVMKVTPIEFGDRIVMD